MSMLEDAADRAGRLMRQGFSTRQAMELAAKEARAMAKHEREFVAGYNAGERGDAEAWLELNELATSADEAWKLGYAAGRRARGDAYGKADDCGA